MKKIGLFSIIAMGLLSSCYTPNMVGLTKDRSKNLSQDINRVQIFNSDQIVLERVIASGSTEIVYGQVIDRGSVKIDQVIIRAHEKGEVMNLSYSNRDTVGFDADATRLLMFDYDGTLDRFYLVCQKEKDHEGNEHPRVQYGEYKFWVMEGYRYSKFFPGHYIYPYINGAYRETWVRARTETYGAHLLFDYVRENSTEVNTTYATGRTVH